MVSHPPCSRVTDRRTPDFLGGNRAWWKRIFSFSKLMNLLIAGMPKQSFGKHSPFRSRPMDSRVAHSKLAVRFTGLVSELSLQLALLFIVLARCLGRFRLPDLGNRHIPPSLVLGNRLMTVDLNYRNRRLLACARMCQSIFKLADARTLRLPNSLLFPQSQRANSTIQSAIELMSVFRTKGTSATGLTRAVNASRSGAAVLTPNSLLIS